MPPLKKDKNQVVKITYISLLGNTALAIVKGVTGFFGHSFALIADAIESTSDIFVSLLVLFGLKYSTKPPDENHPYGHGKAEPLVTFVVVGFLVISATVIFYQGIQNIQTAHEEPKPYTLWVLGTIIVIKEVFYRIISRKSRKTKSTALEADAWHHRSDAITSFAAFIGISIALISGYESADDWAALIASLIILYNAYGIFRPALGEVMDEHVYDDLVEEVREISKQVPGVIDTEKCFVRKTGMTYYVDLHVTVDAFISVQEGHDISHQLKDTLLEKLPQISDVLIHIEPHTIKEEVNN